MIITSRRLLLALAACVGLAAPGVLQAQSTHDEQQQLIAQIQSDKFAIVLGALELDDAQVQAFTPVYDRYQAERKKLYDRAAELLEQYASSYNSMTDEAATRILKDWFELQGNEVALARKYAKQLEKVLPPAKVVRVVQVESKLDTMLKLKAVGNVPLAR